MIGFLNDEFNIKLLCFRTDSDEIGKVSEGQALWMYMNHETL